MIFLLAFRHLVVRPARSAFLLLGFALGVGVMIVLLSVGEAMVEQSRDVALVGGGAVTVLPEGIDLEALRTGGLTSMFFGIDHARFVGRQLVGGPRYAGLVSAVSPAIAGKMLYLERDGRVIIVRADGAVPSRAAAVGAAPAVLAGHWTDTPADSAWIAPTPQQLYDQLDHFHIPKTSDSTWAEWDYFNIVVAPGEWWYVTLLVGGALPDGRWGGQVLVTHRRSDGAYERFTSAMPSTQISFDTAAADLQLGGSSVRQRDGVYQIDASAAGRSGPVHLSFQLTPLARRYFPPVEFGGGGDFQSGYVVPALVARASGTLCHAGHCTELSGAEAYHDHNWGVWRAVTWEWGAAHGDRLAVLYGGIRQSTEDSNAAAAPFFLAAFDSLGLRQVLRFGAVDYTGRRPVVSTSGARPEQQVAAPAAFELTATRQQDTVRLAADMLDALASRTAAASFGRYFVQMRGSFSLTGRLGGAGVSDSGRGFFETYVPASPTGSSPVVAPSASTQRSP